MTPERLQEIRYDRHTYWTKTRRPTYNQFTAACADIDELLDHIDAQAQEIAALRRGQGTAPAPAGPGTTPFHVTHPIPDSTGGTR